MSYHGAIGRLVIPKRAHCRLFDYTNTLSKRSAKIQGGFPTDQSVIYAATCKKCQLMYVGQTGDALNCRFNRHRSDILCYPN